MNKEFIIECLNIIDQIKLNSIVAITKNEEESKYRVNYIRNYEVFELTCVDEENAYWNDGETLEEVKESLVCDAVKDVYQKIRLIS